MSHRARAALVGCGLAIALAGQETTAARAAPALRVRARVVDAAGLPIAGAGAACGTETTTAAALDAPLATSDADGRLSFEVASPVEGQVVMLAARGKVAWRLPLQLPWSGYDWLSWVRGTRELDLGELRLLDGVTLRGRVRDAGGAPVTGARVLAFDELHPGWCASEAKTDPKGLFVLPGVLAQGMRITVSAPGCYPTVLRAVGVGTPLDVELEPSGFVAGELPAVEGRPFDGWLQLHGEFANEQPAAAIRASGTRFRIGVATRGWYRVLAVNRQPTWTARSDVLRGPATGVVLAPPVASFVVRGVDAASGRPIPALHATVSWWDPRLHPILQMYQPGCDRMPRACSESKVRAPENRTGA